MMKRALPFLFVLLIVACGEPPPGAWAPEPEPVDAGLDAPDASEPERVDAGTDTPDAGPPAPIDAGETTPDAGPLEPPDAGPDDAGIPDAGAPDAGAAGVPTYPFDRTHSPLTPEIAQHLQTIALLGPTREADVFSKVGDSNTVSTNHLHCFAGANVNLAGRTHLSPVLTHFRAGQVGVTTPFDRTSLAATIGWQAGAPLNGNPPPLQREVDTAQPRYATVMFGTNDVGFADPYTYGRNLFTIIDMLSMLGVVPIVSSIPHRDDSTRADAWVPRFNLVARGVAQSRRVPFVDLFRELENAPAHGLGSDGIHFNVFRPNGNTRPCIFNAAGLAYGHNVRNLVTLEALDRTWNSVEGRVPPDATGPRRTGSGLPGDEIVIASLPFVDVRDTRTDGISRINSYPSCGSTADESGREVLYRLELTQPTQLRAFVVSLGTSDIDLHLLSSTSSGAGCIERDDKLIVRSLPAGTYWLSLDTYRSRSAGLLPGEYLLAVLAE